MKLLLFKPSKKTTKYISSRGKGYSELKMIIEGNKIIKKNHKNSIIHKISGRYKILNLKNLIKKVSLFLKKIIIFSFPIQNYYQVFNYIFLYKSDIEENIFDNCLLQINDSKYIYLEHSMFKNLVIKKKVLRNKNIPRLEFNMIGGSNQGRYGRLKQTINKFLYGYF